MSTGECPFDEIVIDFVAGVLEAEAYNLILEFINQFTQVHPHILGMRSWIAADVAEPIINNIWRLHDLLRYIS